MSGFGGIHTSYLHRPASVQRALKVACPLCRELPGTACAIEDGKPAVHAARESLAYHGRKIWT